MASRTKKKATKKAVVAPATSDTITFKKQQLIDKLQEFLEEHEACDGDWLNKVRVEFLGEKISSFNVQLRYDCSVSLEMASNGIPSKEEVGARLRQELEEGTLDVEIDYENFEILDIEDA